MYLVVCVRLFDRDTFCCYPEEVPFSFVFATRLLFLFFLGQKPENLGYIVVLQKGRFKKDVSKRTFQKGRVTESHTVILYS